MSLRRCPACGSEYLDWVTTCPECGVALGEPEAGTEDVDGAEPAQAGDVDAPEGGAGSEGAGGEPLQADAEAGGSGRVTYELGDWSPRLRVALSERLLAEGIPHAWERVDLIVGEADEDLVDELVAALDPDVELEEAPPLPEGATAGEAGAAGDEDDDGEILDAVIDDGDEDDEDARDDDLGDDLLAWDLDEWGPEERAQIDTLLTEAGVPHTWESSATLVVPVEAEGTVEQILDQVEHPDALAAVPDEPGDDRAIDLLGELFVAADRLQHDAHDHEGVIGLVDAAGALAPIGVPYGFPQDVWSDAIERASVLRSLLMAESGLESGDGEADEEPEDAVAGPSGEVPDEDAGQDQDDIDEEAVLDSRILTLAAELRALLRPYI